MAEVSIPYNSVPDYDNWGYDSFWDLATWVAWHRGLVSKYGRSTDTDGYPKADKIWLSAWVKQGSYSSPILAIIQPSRFKAETDYIKKFPLLYQYSGLKRASEGLNPLETSYTATKLPFDVAGNVVDAVSDIGDSIGTTGKILKYGVPVLVLTAMGLMILYGYNKVKQTK